MSLVTDLVTDLVAPGAGGGTGAVHVVGYALSIGGWKVDSAADPKTELIALEVLSSMSTPADYVRVVLHNPAAPAPDLLGQALAAAASAVGGALGGALGGDEPAAPPAAFSTQVRGEKIEPGMPLTVSLTAGSRTGTVATTAVRAIDVVDGRTTIVGRSGMQVLAERRLNQVYENQTLRQIVSDLAAQSGVDVGTVAQGDRYPYLVADETRTVERICRDLARREACDFYVGPDGALTVATFAKTRPDHTFHYGIDLLELRVRKHEPSHDRVVVYGESPSSRDGIKTSHWLTKDSASFTGAAGDGVRVAAFADGAVRSKAAADRLAAARQGAAADQATSGRLRLLGNPTVKLGDAVEVAGVADPALNGLFKVVSVRHVLNKDDGYVTWVNVTGAGGAAGAAPGGLAGAIGGALGI